MDIKPCYVGIDPAFRESGFAICVIDETNEVAFKVFKDFSSFLDWIFEAPELCYVCVENSNLQNATFDMSGSKMQVAKKSRDVGKNQAASQYTTDACRKAFGKNKVFEISPRQKGAKIKDDSIIFAMGKAKKHIFVKSKLNQDERDAYKIALIGLEYFTKQQNAKNRKA